MQDLRSIAAGAAGNGPIFGGFGDRRMRTAHPQQPLKCPRCESLNTKFCYYNNYNLSQPRHFCKSCRRYWTKGGVLRNVPVGGGCRKPKRSSKPKPSSSSPPPPPPQPPHPDPKSASHSSSDSSTLTAATARATTVTTPPPAVAAEVVPASSTVLTYVNPAFEVMESFSTQASDPVGSFTSLMTGSNSGVLGFGFEDLAGNATFPFEFQQQQPQQKVVLEDHQIKMQDLTYLDQTVVQHQQQRLQLGDNRASNGGGMTALDWESNGDHQGLFDLTGGVVLDQSYWNNSQWGESDPALFLP